MEIGSISIPQPLPSIQEVSFSSALGAQPQSDVFSAPLSQQSLALVDNYRANLGSSNLNPAQLDAATERFSSFLRVAEQTPGVNVQDGLSGNEYLLVANSINDNPTLKDKFQSLDTTIGTARPEIYGQYGVDGRFLLDAAGNRTITVDEAAAEFNRMMKSSVEEAETTQEAAGSEETDETEDASSTEEADAASSDEPEEDTASNKGDAGGSSMADMMASLWPFLLGLFDTDNDGRISPEEFMKGMAKLDKNKDGKITKNELIAAGASEEQATQLMASMDKNADGSISLSGADSEVQAFVTAANENGDTEISQDEITAALEAAATAPPAETEAA
jgi:hypothetical protein